MPHPPNALLKSSTDQYDSCVQGKESDEFPRLYNPFICCPGCGVSLDQPAFADASSNICRLCNLWGLPSNGLSTVGENPNGERRDGPSRQTASDHSGLIQARSIS